MTNDCVGNSDNANDSDVADMDERVGVVDMEAIGGIGGCRLLADLVDGNHPN